MWRGCGWSQPAAPLAPSLWSQACGHWGLGLGGGAGPPRCRWAPQVGPWVCTVGQACTCQILPRTRWYTEGSRGPAGMEVGGPLLPVLRAAPLGPGSARSQAGCTRGTRWAGGRRREHSSVCRPAQAGAGSSGPAPSPPPPRRLHPGRGLPAGTGEPLMWLGPACLQSGMLGGVRGEGRRSAGWGACGLPPPPYEPNRLCLQRR